MDFVHLNVHTEHSIYDSVVRAGPLGDALEEAGYHAVAVTDWGNIFGLVKMYQAMQKRGIKLIIGAQIDFADMGSILLLCRNEAGFKLLKQIISDSYLNAPRNPVPTPNFNIAPTEDLLAIACFKTSALSKDLDNAEPILQELQRVFADRLYLELIRANPQDEPLVQKTLEFAQRHRLKVVATNNVRFLTAKEYSAHEARVAILEGSTLDSRVGRTPYTDQMYLKTAEQMVELFKDVPSALSNTVAIARQCTTTVPLGEVHLPDYPPLPGQTIEQTLRTLSFNGLKKRFANPASEYTARLDTELEVINTMGFAGYFLIVADFIRWAKEHGIPVGPGRGSGAGSLVAYVLDITDLDPITNQLLFERFLNPERVSMPDFDIDFCMERRDEVIQYVAQRYGRMAVSQIATFGTMAAKAVVRDCGRVLGHGYGFVDKIAKLVPFELGMTLKKALEQEPKLAERYKDEEEVRTLLDYAMQLEGLVRSVGKHAGGVVIAPGELTDFTPLYCEQGSTQLVSGFDKDDVEAAGLVKFDFLGLRTLTIIDWAVKALAKDGVDIDIASLTLTDKASFDLLKRCQTTAVFQLESRGMKELIRRLQPDNFEEIVALVALFRPGPLQSGMVDDFINRKHGRAEVVYPHPALKSILQPTYGVILYQEQVMQIAQELAGYSLGAADLLRRAMGKKKPEEMAQQREIFLKGALENSVDEDTANYIFDLMEKFAGYGFNKSHSAAYALVSYQTAYLKAHYPAQFMAAVLSADMAHTEKLVGLIEDCKEIGLKVVPPCINSSGVRFSGKDGRIIYGLGAIKGVGEAALSAIIEERNNGEYKDLNSFLRRNTKKVNRRVVQTLIKSGALDCFNCSRSQMLFDLEDALRQAQKIQQDELQGQVDLFGMQLSRVATAPEMSKLETLQGEKETLGIYISGHPMEYYAVEAASVVTAKIGELMRKKGTVTICGMVVGLRTMNTKRGDRMAWVTLDDGSSRSDIAVFGDAYQNAREAIVMDACLLIKADVRQDNGESKLRALEVFDWQQYKDSAPGAMTITLQSDFSEMEKLKILLSAHAPGAITVSLQVNTVHGVAKLASDISVKNSPEFVAAMRELVGEDNVALRFEEKKELAEEQS